MDSAIPAISVPKVSVIIPARNEESNLERCLRSLVVQKGIAFDIFIVNDASTDRTREIAESFTRVRQCPFIALNQDLLDVHVIDAPQPLPAGWSGKVNALVAGEKVAGEKAAGERDSAGAPGSRLPLALTWETPQAKAARETAAADRAQYLLFTDADTEHLEGSLAAAVAEAETSQADLLSYSPEQLLTGVRQRLLMPLIFGELAFRYSPRRVSDPALPDAAANGQYLLVRAATHRQLGGFSSVATDLLEDVALARLYKSQGRTIVFRLGRNLVRTRMYSSWEELRAGWTKNLALLFPDARQLARKRLQEFRRLIISLVVAPLSALYLLSHPQLSRDWFWPTMLALYWFFTLIGFAGFYARIARAHFPFWSSLFSVFGLPSFAALLRRSASAHQQGSVTWRGRTYPTAGAESHAIASNPK